MSLFNMQKNITAWPIFMTLYNEDDIKIYKYLIVSASQYHDKNLSTMIYFSLTAQTFYWQSCTLDKKNPYMRIVK